MLYLLMKQQIKKTKRRYRQVSAPIIQSIFPPAQKASKQRFRGKASNLKSEAWNLNWVGHCFYEMRHYNSNPFLYICYAFSNKYIAAYQVYRLA